MTVIATGFREIRAREDLARLAVPRRQVAQPQGLEMEPPAQGVRPETPFLRKGQNRAPAFSPDEGGYGPNFTNLKDDLDVPTFLRKKDGTDEDDEEREKPAFLRRSAD